MKSIRIYMLLALIGLQFGFTIPIGNKSVFYNPNQPEYHVALMMPFYLHNPEKRNSAASKAVYDYYEGIQMAISILEKEGLNMVLHVYDTEADSQTVDSIMQLPEMLQMNTIFGPIYEKPHAVAEAFCAKTKIPLIAPFNFYQRKNTSSFPHINLNPSDSIEAFGMGQSLARLYPNNELLIISDNKPEHYKKRKLFKEGFTLINKREVKTIQENDLSQLYELSKTKLNYIVYAPTNNIEVLDKLINLSAAGKIKLVFAKDIKSIEGMDKQDLIRGNVMFGDNDFYNKYDEHIVDFRKCYRERFRWDANLWHFKGYDQFLWLGRSLMAFKQNYPSALKTAWYAGLVQQFSLKPTANGGYENSGCKVAIYDSNGKRQEVK